MSDSEVRDAERDYDLVPSWDNFRVLCVVRARHYVEPTGARLQIRREQFTRVCFVSEHHVVVYLAGRNARWFPCRPDQTTRPMLNPDQIEHGAGLLAGYVLAAQGWGEDVACE